MENLKSRNRNFKLPGKNEISLVFSSFSKMEWIVFVGFLIIMSFSALSLLQSINQSFMVQVPSRGGSISEGIVETPRFINPVLANSLADQTLVSLIYSGLLRKDSSGGLIPDLAEKYDVSPDGLIYTFILKNNLYFQDGTSVSADDVLFTINELKNSIIKSSRKVDWDGVSIEKINEKTIKFTLKRPFASFLENATIGIMPAHLWDSSPMELNSANTNPVGSGPYMIRSISKQSSGIINYYELAPFKKFILGEPYIKKISLHFYSNEDDLIAALRSKEIDQVSSITPSNAKILKEDNYQVESDVLPRIFGLFFNQNVNNLFLDKTVVRAIDQAIDKDKIVRNVLFGYGITIDDPIPPNIIKQQKFVPDLSVSRQDLLQKVENDLNKDGWNKGVDGFLEKTKNEKGKKTTTKLAFSISTGNVPELIQTAKLIKEDLLAIGMNVDVKTFETGNLNQNVIRPRKYEALLFGEIINHGSDLFAFWHSSQRKDPGLNVAMYTNTKVDKILEDAAVTVDEQSRINKYLQFEDEIKKDMPAVFLYSPDFIYIVSKNLRQFRMNNIISSSDRYLNIYSWYNQTENIWKIFAK